ncbi:MAG: metallophosphoesterase [Cyclobacteriaceae bacterium]|nr:metallophosphoesterase [Cyclobacteriaceae bacterium]
MKKLILLCAVLTTGFYSFGQEKPTIYIDIPSQQKPWNNLNWNTSESQFQFAIVTDRTGGHRHGIFPMAIKKLNLLQPEFVMSVGDLIEGYTEDTVRLNAEWKEFRGFIDSLQVPFFYVPGNHDITNAVMAEKWNELFGVSYYHFVYNDVLFLCLNSEDNHRGSGRGTIDDEQYEYIKKTLAENEEVKWTLVFLHQPLWVQEDTKRWNDVEKLLQDREHTVFAGHYHRYWKSVRNNGKYIALATTGGASRLRGRAYGEFDEVAWVTMTNEGPIIANLFLDGIWDENVVTEDLVELVRDRPFPVRLEPVYLAGDAEHAAEAEIRVTNSSDTRMKVKLTGMIHPDIFYTLNERELTVEPNDVQLLKLDLQNLEKFDLSNPEPLVVKADITYEFENQPNVSFSNALNFSPFEKYKIGEVKKVKVDGDLKEWKGEWIDVKNFQGSPFDYKGDADFSMKFATGYDKDNLYVAVQITDDELYIDEKGSYWSQDAFLLGLDARTEYVSAFNEGEGRGSDWLGYLRTFREESPVYGESHLPVKVESAVKRTPTGVQLELAIPVAYLDKMQQKDWSTVRLDLGYYDFDENGRQRTAHFWFPAWDTTEDIPGSGMMFRE